MKIFVVAFITVCVSFSAVAMSTFDAYMYRLADENAVLKIQLCDLTADSKTSEQHADCRLKPQSDVKARYLTAAKALKKPAQKLAFKNYYAVVLTQIKAVDVISGETVRGYDNRQRDAKTRADEAWIGFEVEL